MNHTGVNHHQCSNGLSILLKTLFIRKMLNMHFPFTPKTGHMLPRQPNNITRASGRLGKLFELRVHDFAALCAEDGGFDGGGIEVFADRGVYCG